MQTEYNLKATEKIQTICKSGKSSVPFNALTHRCIMDYFENAMEVSVKDLSVKYRGIYIGLMAGVLIFRTSLWSILAIVFVWSSSVGHLTLAMPQIQVYEWIHIPANCLAT